MNESQVADAFTRDDCLRRRVGSKPARQAVTTAWILAAFAAHPIAAEVHQPTGWYIGGGVSSTNVFAVESTGYFGSSERGAASTGFVINGGYRWSPNMAIEVGYVEGGSPEFDTITTLACIVPEPCRVDVEQDTSAVELSAIGILPLGAVWEIYLKGGLALWDASSDQVLVSLGSGGSATRRIDTDGTDFLLGVGAGATIGEHARLRIEYQAFRTNDQLLGLDSNREARFDLLALEFHWRF